MILPKRQDAANSLCNATTIRQDYKRAAPANRLNVTTTPQTRGAASNVGTRRPDAALLLELAEADELLVLVAPEPYVAVTLPAPADAVDVLPPVASCEPGPLRPGPLPAPFLKYFAAPDGVAGSALPVNGDVSQLLL